jgi:hypothetical protein
MSAQQPMPRGEPDHSGVPRHDDGPMFWTAADRYEAGPEGDDAWVGVSEPYGHWQPPPPRPPRNRRSWLIVVAAAIVVLLAVVAVVNAARNHSSNSGQAAPGPLPGGTMLPAPLPSGSPSTGPGDGISVPAVHCPVITDTQSHLRYRCIDNSLVQSDPDEYLGLRVSLTLLVEPNWALSEGSGDPSAYRRNPVLDAAGSSLTAGPSLQDVRSTVEARTARAVQDAYGPSPTSHVLAAHTREFGTTTGFELVTLISMDTQFRAETGLKAKTERLWVVGVPTVAGVSIFMLSIPDDRSDLWPKAEATVGTISVT